MYQLPPKTEKAAKVYLELWEEQAHPSINKTAKLSKVSWGFANLDVTELKAIGQLCWIPNSSKDQKTMYSGQVRSSALSTRCSFCLLGNLMQPNHYTAMCRSWNGTSESQFPSTSALLTGSTIIGVMRGSREGKSCST
jgi:hypothetical protein